MIGVELRKRERGLYMLSTTARTERLVRQVQVKEWDEGRGVPKSRGRSERLPTRRKDSRVALVGSDDAEPEVLLQV